MMKYNVWDITKSVLAVIVIGTIFFNAGFLKGWMNSLTQPEITETQITRIAENIVKAQVVANEKAFKELMKEMKADRSEVLRIAREQGKRIDELGRVVGQLDFSIQEMKPKDVTVIESPQAPEKKLAIITAKRKDAKGEAYPVGNIYYSPNMEKIEDRIVYTPFELDFFVDVVQTEEENGTFDRLVELSLESNHIKEYRGKKFAVKIEDLKWVKNPVKIKKFRFNPRLGFAGEFTNEDLSPAVDISFFSYGRTKRDMDWRFLALSVGGDKNKVNFGVTPVQWNFGNVVPLVENAFVGPVVVGDTDGEVSYGGTLSIPF